MREDSSHDTQSTMSKEAQDSPSWSDQAEPEEPIETPGATPTKVDPPPIPPLSQK